MITKLKKYYSYAERFVKSPNKTGNFQVLLAEIKDKGLVTGIKSVLHIKAGSRGDYGFPDYTGGIPLHTYDKSVKVTLPHNTNPLVSIIIPAYNQLDYTYNCIRSIYEHNSFTNYEIIIADDNSPDDSSVLLSQFDNLAIVKNATNLGFLKNCNHAATKAKGEYLVFLNNDTQVLNNWLSELLYVFENFPKAGLVGSMLIYPDGLLQEAGGIIWQDGSGANYGNRNNPAKPEYNYIKEVDYISGASIMIRTTLWKEIGGFDERFSPAYCEDSDLCFAVREKGYEVIYQPFSRIIHFEGISHGTDVEKGVKQYQVINNRKLVEKWQPVLQHKSKNGHNVFSERDRTTGKKHVLIIDHNVPTIDKDAGSRTITNFVDSLLSLDYSVKFMVPNLYPEYHYTKLLQQKGVEVLHGDSFVYLKHEWEGYFSNNINKFDAIILSRSSICTPYIKYLKRHNYPGKMIYYGHDLGFLRTEQEIKMGGKKGLEKLLQKTKADEDYMYSNADAALVISHEELAYLKKYVDTPLHYIPPYFFEIQQTTKPFNSRKGILFVGGFQHPPNQDAIRWFVENMYESLEKEGIYLTIAGSEMPQFVLDYKKKYPSLTILPDVPILQLEELYANAKIAIVPLTVGAGVKGKVIEAMAKGVPIVGTDKAFEGLYKTEDFLYKDINDPLAFIAEIMRIYNNAEFWEQLSVFGKAYVSQYFNKAIMKDTLQKIIE